jgi:Fic family protein
MSKMKFLISQYTQFMVESNAIEGETGLNPMDIRVMNKVVSHGIKNETRLLEIHGLLTQHLNVRWSGKYRDCQVFVGKAVPPAPAALPYKMKEFFERLPRLSSWEAHNVFECIHPFQDFNGRTGRLIWLSKALGEMKNPFNLPFLRHYYYQTIEHWSGDHMKRSEHEYDT